MAYNDNNFGGEGGSGNVWSSGSQGFRGGYSRPGNDDGGQREGGGSYRGSFGNNNSRRGGSGGGGAGGGGSYGFRRDNNSGDVEIQRDAIFIQNLPKNITLDELNDVFSVVGPIKVDDRSGGPKIWIYRDRETDEPNGRATVTFEDEDSANKAIADFNDQHIESIDATVRVQLAQRRRRTDGDRGGRGGYRGGRNNWDNNNSRQGFSSGGNRWGGSGGGFSDGRSGGDGFRSRGGGGDSYRDGGDRGDSYRGSRGGQYRGASRGNGGSSNYSPY